MSMISPLYLSWNNNQKKGGRDWCAFQFNLALQLYGWQFSVMCLSRLEESQEYFFFLLLDTREFWWTVLPCGCTLFGKVCLVSKLQKGLVWLRVQNLEGINIGAINDTDVLLLCHCCSREMSSSIFEKNKVICSHCWGTTIITTEIFLGHSLADLLVMISLARVRERRQIDNSCIPLM